MAIMAECFQNGSYCWHTILLLDFLILSSKLFWLHCISHINMSKFWSYTSNLNMIVLKYVLAPRWDFSYRVLTRILKIGVPETSFRKSRSPTM